MVCFRDGQISYVNHMLIYANAWLRCVSGTIMFELRRRTADMAPAKRKKKRHGEDMVDPRGQPQMMDRLPMLVEINPGE